MKNMNYYEYTVLKCKNEFPDLSQREIAKRCNVSLGLVNKILKNNSFFKYQKNKRNAIILAAGIGQRLLPLNNHHKAFIKINNEFLIERLIKQLKEANIDEIYVVVGYRKEDFDFLSDLYGVKLIINKDYREKGSFHSLFLAKKYIENTFILACDLYLKDNIFKDFDFKSYYGIKNIKTNNAYITLNKKKEIIKNSDGYKDCGGICFITSEDCLTVKNNLTNNAYYFFEEALFNQNKMFILPKFLDGVYEINDFKDIVNLDINSESLNHPALNIIKEVFKTDLSAINDLKLLKEGMTNDSFVFNFQNNRYIMRIPGIGSNKIINRRQEKLIYDLIKQHKIADEVIYLDAESGYKITKFIEDAHNLDVNNQDELSKAMQLLKKFHHLNLKTDHHFDLFEKIEFYEKLNPKPSKYQDYQKVKQNVLSLKKIIDQADKNWTLCHIDAISDNFLVSKQGINLIDFEYSAMQDSDLDLIMFASYAYFNQSQIDNLFYLYYGYQINYLQKIKVYSYMAVVGLLWSNWCEYKESLNQEFGEYGYKQYRYAKDFYQLVLEMEKNNV